MEKETVNSIQVPNGTAYTITVKKPTGETFVAYLREVDRKTFSKAFSKLRNVSNGGDVDIVEAGEIIFRSCWIGGNPEVLTEDKLLLSACLQCYEMIEVYESDIKKN